MRKLTVTAIAVCALALAAAAPAHAALVVAAVNALPWLLDVADAARDVLLDPGPDDYRREANNSITVWDGPEWLACQARLRAALGRLGEAG